MSNRQERRAYKAARRPICRLVRTNMVDFQLSVAEKMVELYPALVDRALELMSKQEKQDARS